MANAVASGGIALPVLAALVLGPGPFAAVLAVLAVLTLVDLSGVLTRAAARPILPAALIPAVGLPAAVAFRPDLGWDVVPGVVAGGFGVAFLFALVFGRRRGIVEGAGTTMLAGLVVGLGGASLVLLRLLPEGFRWVLAFAVIVVAADVSGPLWARLRGRSSHGAEQYDVLAPLVGAILAAAGLSVALGPPLDVPVAALLTLIAVTAAIGGADLQRNLVAEAEASPPRERSPLGSGLLFGIVDGVLLGAPVAYVLARSATL